MSSNTELRPVNATEDVITKQTTQISVQSEQNLKITGSKKSLNRSLKSEQDVQDVEDKIQSSIKSGSQNVENKHQSIKSSQIVEPVAVKKSLGPSTKSNEEDEESSKGVGGVELEAEIKSSIQSNGRHVENKNQSNGEVVDPVTAKKSLDPRTKTNDKDEENVKSEGVEELEAEEKSVNKSSVQNIENKHQSNGEVVESGAAKKSLGPSTKTNDEDEENVKREEGEELEAETKYVNKSRVQNIENKGQTTGEVIEPTANLSSNSKSVDEDVTKSAAEMNPISTKTENEAIKVTKTDIVDNISLAHEQTERPNNEDTNKNKPDNAVDQKGTNETLKVETVPLKSFQGGFISNKDVKRPSITEDPTLARSGTSRLPPASHPQQQPLMHALVGLIALTILMRFFMSNFKFFFVVVYAALVAMVALGYWGHGPFVRRRRP